MNDSTTMLRSFPHAESQALCPHLVETLDISAWPQLPRRTCFENMYVQCSHGLPGVEIWPQEYSNRSIISTSCVLGSTTVEVAEKVLEVHKQTGELLQEA